MYRHSVKAPLTKIFCHKHDSAGKLSGFLLLSDVAFRKPIRWLDKVVASLRAEYDPIYTAKV